MKRGSILKRTTPLRRFRHDDDAEQRASHAEAKHAIDRAVQVVDTGVYIAGEYQHLAVEPPVKTSTLTLSRAKRRALRKRTAYAQRERHVEYMLWVKAQPCLMAPHGGCSGVVEADHAGLDRGMGMKAHDNTCVPLCSRHHYDRHNFTGPFKHYTKDAMKAWRELAIALTQQQAKRCGIEVPT